MIQISIQVASYIIGCYFVNILKDNNFFHVLCVYHIKRK